MKKIVSFLILTFCMLALLSVVASAVTLTAGQSIDAGTVTVSHDGVNLYITYETIDGWELVETHLAVATSSEVIPQTKNGNPIPGKFTYSMEHDPAVTEYTYEITLEWVIGTKLYIAAQAEVRKQIGVDESTGDPIYQEETGWGEGSEFAGKNWAMFFTFVVDVVQ
jgi:hypothetical protein